MHLNHKNITLAFALCTLSFTLLSCSPVSPKPTPTLIFVFPTETRRPSLTPRASKTPTPTASALPSPTKTATAQPGWVTGFAQPILTAIADRTPSFQDDFGPGSAGWKEDWCEGSMKYSEGELVITNCRVFRPNTDWRDIALKIDMRFVEGTKTLTEWALHFRDVGNSGHNLNLYHNGNIAIGFTKGKGETEWVELRNPVLTNDQTHQILLIARGNRFAFYLDGKPLYYGENSEYLFGRCVFFAESGSVAMDNLQIWDISNIPIP
jgi:hypothetical protein